MVLEFGTNEYFVNESDGMVDVDIVKTGTNERPVFVMITAQPDSTGNCVYGCVCGGCVYLVDFHFTMNPPTTCR